MVPYVVGIAMLFAMVFVFSVMEATIHVHDMWCLNRPMIEFSSTCLGYSFMKQPVCKLMCAVVLFNNLHVRCAVALATMVMAGYRMGGANCEVTESGSPANLLVT